jgi:hypothetical protein
MKYILPSLTCSALTLAASLLAAAEPADSGQLPTGQQLLADAADRLALQPAIAAKIRHQVDLFGQQLVGSGTYQQLLADNRTLVRMELKLQIDDRLTTLQQINDGVILWIRRDQGDQKQVSYVNLRRVQETARTAKPARAGSMPSDAMALGGLPQLLRGLQQNFQFETPTEEMLGDVPVWVLQGEWKTEKLVELLPDMRKDRGAASPSPPTDRLPPHLPDHVTVILGRDDFVPLFPYRVEYSRTTPSLLPTAAWSGRAGEKTASRTRKTIVKMELFEVRRQWELDPRAFEYQLGDQAIEDHTELYIQRLGLLNK